MTKLRLEIPRQVIEDAADQGIGLGDLVAMVTKKLGIKECAGCRRRRAALNKVRLPALRQKRGAHA